MPGPVPKRSTQRRRRNSPPAEVVTPKPRAKRKPARPPADKQWHPIARRWYESLADSGQSQFYEASDWGTAYVLAESMSRELSPQPMLVGRGEAAHVEMVTLPPKGASLSAWLKAMTSLLVTEGDRRRLRIELERPSERDVDDEAADAAVLQWKKRLSG